jgi:hypothetical protein
MRAGMELVGEGLELGAFEDVVVVLPEDDPIRVETCSISNKYKLNQFIPIIELRCIYHAT